MRTRNPNYGRALDTAKGRISPVNAGSRGITMRDSVGTEAHPVRDVTFNGPITITDNDDGTIVVTFGTTPGDPNAGDYVLKFNGGIEWVHTIAISGSSQALDLADANVFDITLSADCTITTTGWTDGYLCSIVVDLTLATFTPTFSSVWWLDPVTGAPTLTPPAFPTDTDAKARVVLSSRDGGTTVWAHLVGSGAGSAAAIEAFGFVGPILISDTPSTPLVFADLIQNEAQNDLVYADVG